MFYEGGLALFAKLFLPDSRAALFFFYLKYSWWWRGRRGGAANGASPGAGDSPLQATHPPNYPKWTPAVICHPDRQRPREVEGGESAVTADMPV